MQKLYTTKNLPAGRPNSADRRRKARASRCGRTSGTFSAEALPFSEHFAAASGAPKEHSDELCKDFEPSHKREQAEARDWRSTATAFSASFLESAQSRISSHLESIPTGFAFPNVALPDLPQFPLPSWPTSRKKAGNTSEMDSLETSKQGKGGDSKDHQTQERERLALELLQEQAGKNEAVQLLKKRASEGSKFGSRADAFKLGLVVEGGGMRGAVSGGALQALHDLGLRDCFDAVYGSSAGAINGTYFLAGQRTGVDIYSQDITTPKFIDLKRLLKSSDKEQRPALDLEFLLDYVMNEIKPLDWQAVVDSPIPLKVVASCLDTLQPVLLEDFVSEADLRESLRASATVPVVAGNPVQHRGSSLVDAAVFEAIPFRAAIADGCTHIIALPTRPPYKKGDFLGRWIDDNVSNIVKKAVLSPNYMKRAWIRELEYQRAFGITPEELLVKGLEPGHHKLAAMAGCHVFPIFPGPASSYSPLCIDAATVMLGIAEGRSSVFKLLGTAEQQAASYADRKEKAAQVKPAKTKEPVAAKSNAI